MVFVKIFVIVNQHNTVINMETVLIFHLLVETNQQLQQIVQLINLPVVQTIPLLSVNLVKKPLVGDVHQCAEKNQQLQIVMLLLLSVIPHQNVGVVQMNVMEMEKHYLAEVKHVYVILELQEMNVNIQI